MLYSIFYFFMYGSSFIAMQYLNIYYKEIGLNRIDISKIIIISTLATIFSSIFWGYRFDKSNKKHIILYMLIIGSMVFFSAISFFDKFYLILIFNIFFSIFYFSLQPLFTTTTLYNLEKKGKNYGVIRFFGTMGFCVFSVVIPMIRHEKTIFIAMIIVCIIMIIVFSIIVKKDKLNSERKKRNFKIKELFTNKVIIRFILFVSLINITTGAYFSFFGIYFIDELGYSKKLFGILCAISTLSEIPFLIFSNKIFDRFSIKTILLFSGVITSIRWLLCFFFISAYGLIAISTLHGLGFIVLITTINIYINNNCDKDYLASMQSLFFISTLVFSKIFGALIGGVLPKLINQRYVFLINSAICVFSCLYLFYADKYE